jgi:hypothetical protein
MTLVCGPEIANGNQALFVFSGAQSRYEELLKSLKLPSHYLKG